MMNQQQAERMTRQVVRFRSWWHDRMESGHWGCAGDGRKGVNVNMNSASAMLGRDFACCIGVSNVA